MGRASDVGLDETLIIESPRLSEVLRHASFPIVGLPPSLWEGVYGLSIGGEPSSTWFLNLEYVDRFEDARRGVGVSHLRPQPGVDYVYPRDAHIENFANRFAPVEEDSERQLGQRAEDGFPPERFPEQDFYERRTATLESTHLSASYVAMCHRTYPLAVAEITLADSASTSLCVASWEVPLDNVVHRLERVDEAFAAQFDRDGSR